MSDADPLAVAIAITTSSLEFRRKTPRNDQGYLEDVRELVKGLTAPQALLVLIGLGDIASVLVTELARERQITPQQLVQTMAVALANARGTHDD